MATKTVHCECGEIHGDSCIWCGPASETVVIYWMPESLRDAHTAARNSGSYPHNGSIALRLSQECADILIRDDGEWTELARK